MSKLKRYYLNRPYQFLLILFLKLIVSVCEVSISFCSIPLSIWSPLVLILLPFCI